MAMMTQLSMEQKHTMITLQLLTISMVTTMRTTTLLKRKMMMMKTKKMMMKKKRSPRKVARRATMSCKFSLRTFAPKKIDCTKRYCTQTLIIPNNWPSHCHCHELLNGSGSFHGAMIYIRRSLFTD